MPKLCVAAIVLLPTLANADVVDRSPAGFTVRTVVTIAAPPERAFRALVDDIGRWWDSSHTVSGDAANLRLAATPGGCFCETLKNSGGVAHAVVNHVVPGEMIRMTGALGPLQETATTGTVTWQFAASGQDTIATLTYSVGGYFPGGLEKIADPVDQVMSDQLRRLKAYLERGTSAGAADSDARPSLHCHGPQRHRDTETQRLPRRTALALPPRRSTSAGPSGGFHEPQRRACAARACRGLPRPSSKQVNRED